MEGQSGDRLPPPLDQLWGGATRARRRGLSVDQVVAAAIDLADEGGLEAASMSQIAERVGFTTMAIYRHVRSKDDLIALMVDTAVGVPSTLDPPAQGWRAGLERWSWELQALVARHPWLVGLPLARMPFGPNRLAWLESGLQALAGTPLEELEKATVLLLLNGYVFSEARLSGEIAAGEAGEEVPEQGDFLSAIVDPDRYPATRRALEAGIFRPSGRDRDADFAFGLDRILDGIDQLIRREAAKSE